MATKKPKRELIATDTQDMHIVTLSKRGAKEVHVFGGPEEAEHRSMLPSYITPKAPWELARDLFMNAFEKGWKRAETVTLRPWADGSGAYGVVGKATYTKHTKAEKARIDAQLAGLS